MSSTHALHEAGQSLWLDSISRSLLSSGTLARYVSELYVTGLTSNPTIFDQAISGTNAYDDAIRECLGRDLSTEELFFEIALRDITEAADLLRPAHDASGGRDGFASIEVSPDLADDAAGTIREARSLHARAERPNVMIKVPGTPAGFTAIEDLIGAGIPVNVTLLFSRAQYRGAAEAYVCGLERRVEAGLDPRVASVASVFVSRWDAHTTSQLPPELANRLGIAVARRAYRAFQDLLASGRWKRLAAAGAWPQRPLWASTGTKDPALSESYYVEALAADQTVNTMPEKTLLAFAAGGKLDVLMSGDTADADRVVEAASAHGVDVDELATRLQREGRDAFVESWRDLLGCLESRRNAIRAA